MVMGKLRIGGAWSGVLDIELDEWTVAMLRQEIANRSGCGAPHCLNLICAGRVLRDGDGTDKLIQLGVKNNAKILAAKVSVDQDGKSVKEEFLAEEERSKKLSRLKTAATKLATRHADGSLPVEDFNLELENQSGEKLQLGSETDQRAIMMGLMLHANAKALMRREQYSDALEVLTMGEEAFSLCNQKLIEMVDNVPILQIDMVWCYFMLRDISWLSVAGIRLAKAREGIERAHGKESTRLRILQGGRYPELALHLRMELLEGVIAYHSGQLQKSKDTLTSAQAKYFRLQVPDESLSFFMSMGYKEREAKRALRMNNLDVGTALDFLVEEKAKRAQKREEDLRRQKEILEQKKYGTTPLRKAVNLEKLNELVSIGFQKELAAEALRRNENDTQKALDDLTNPETNAVLQNEIISRKRKRLREKAKSASENLVSMGFERASVEAALHMFGSEEEALNYLVGQPNVNAAEGANPSLPQPDHEVGGSNAEGSGGGPSSLGTTDHDGEGPSSRNDPPEERDMEMEDELTGELQNADAYSDYDIEVTKEGEAISEYLALLNSAENA
ncbi:ubiquitin-associated domain-containing protein [Perilla frutescens var. hirtella]|nr:ubiquitin-associated domain-containing protein [Perilla frutescens var. hirtella]KAH6817363.1 ubiquitin-associated domain-containing protein [Perilla frutescens var. frutescens]